MNSDCRYLSYKDTHSFSKIVLDYISSDEKLRQFYQYPVSVEGMMAAIEARKQFVTDRPLLVSALRKQYNGYFLTDIQENHLQQLLDDNTFTITTAHQPNIFTGHLYFIYKILHTIRLCASLKALIPANNFVPVFYMGSEDADLDELGHINVNGEKLEWETGQSGAVGRMQIQGIEKLVERLNGEFGQLEFGEEMIELLKKSYVPGRNIQQATLFLVNELFRDYGLLVLIPDNASLKRAFEPVVKKELEEQFSHKLVADTIDKLGKHYKVQAAGRDLNLFYLADDGSRERIELVNSKYIVSASGLSFTKEEIFTELAQHPERFSANVILRGIFEEMVLPNIAFIGGGGELAYWLELKSVFEAVGVPYPMLVLRNSFLLMEPRERRLAEHLGLALDELFETELELDNLLTKRATEKKLQLSDEQEQVNAIYGQMQYLAAAVDPGLQPHVAALHTRALKDIYGLEKKMLRSEKRKYTDQHRQLVTLRSRLFPNNSLQERVDNFMPYYAKYGKKLMDIIYKHSMSLEASFGVIELKN